MSSSAQPVPRAKGPYATTRRVGDVLYLAGQGSIDPETGDPVDGDIGAQTRLTLANVERLLGSEGFELEDIVQVVCYLRNIDDWSAMNDAYAGYLGDRAWPTRTAVGVASLPFGLDVEMTCIAHRQSPRLKWCT